MTRDQRTSIPAELRSLFPTRWLNAAARESRLVSRRRKVVPAHLFWTLVLGFAVGHRRSLASLRRFFQASTGVGIVPSSFCDRFTAGTVRFLRRAFARAANHLGGPSGELRRHLARFKDLLVADATVLRLHDALRGGEPPAALLPREELARAGHLSSRRRPPRPVRRDGARAPARPA